MRIPIIFPVMFIVGLSCISPAQGADDISGFWSGTASREGSDTPVHLRLSESADGLIAAFDLPEFGTLGIPLIRSEQKRSKLRLEFGAEKTSHVLEGTLKKDTFSGTWEMPAADLASTIRLTRVPDPRPYSVEDVSFTNGDVRLEGSVLTPNAPGPHPGIVLVHGSGDAMRYRLELLADLFTRNGFVSLIFDKRGCGVSTGDWEKVGFEPLARDNIAGLHFLQSRDDVIADKVGFWGISQAGWIMPLAASLSNDVAFLVVTSGAAVSVEEEGYFDYFVRLRDAGFSEENERAARKILEADFQVSLTGEGYDDVRAMLKEVAREPWWRSLQYFVAPVGNQSRRFYQLIGSFDPVPILNELSIPILWVYGEADKSVEPSRSIAILEPIIDAGKKPWEIVMFPRADHGIRVPPEPGAAFPLLTPAEGYHDAMTAWLHRQMNEAP